MTWFGHLKHRMEVVEDNLAVLANIESLANETFEYWSFDGILKTYIALDIFEYNIFLLSLLLHLDSGFVKGNRS